MWLKTKVVRKLFVDDSLCSNWNKSREVFSEWHRFLFYHCVKLLCTMTNALFNFEMVCNLHDSVYASSSCAECSEYRTNQDSIWSDEIIRGCVTKTWKGVHTSKSTREEDNTIIIIFSVHNDCNY